ncbi:hypothetical protein Pmani_029556 [Petrolisthes manimaculis]|uniref:Uncharacterized protein n=1 Tax=Petrolisthes manimaculis TaxID=1843537 RepID=A0AAE1TWV0_9EUCA|nr:hypothetical protein Pmani_029556 [Petrolisthes manimaculis]
MHHSTIWVVVVVMVTWLAVPSLQASVRRQLHPNASPKDMEMDTTSFPDDTLIHTEPPIPTPPLLPTTTAHELSQGVEALPEAASEPLDSSLTLLSTIETGGEGEGEEGEGGDGERGNGEGGNGEGGKGEGGEGEGGEGEGGNGDGGKGEGGESEGGNGEGGEGEGGKDERGKDEGGKDEGVGEEAAHHHHHHHQQQHQHQHQHQASVPPSSPPSSSSTTMQGHHHHHNNNMQGHHHHNNNNNNNHNNMHVTTGDPTLDLLLASLDDRMNMAHLMDALVVDDKADTEAMEAVHQVAETMKKKGNTMGRSDLMMQLQGQGGTEVEVEGQGLGEGEGGGLLTGVEAEQQQTAEFTLEPHLGPAILPFQVPEGYFVPFVPRRAFGVVNGVARPPHGHGSFYNHRPPGLVDVPNSPAYGYLFSGYRRFQPDRQSSSSNVASSRDFLDAVAALDLTTLDLASLGLESPSLSDLDPTLLDQTSLNTTI